LYLAANKGRAFGCPPSGVESPYLLTGLGTCGVCNGSMCVLTRAHGRRRAAFWGCMVRKQRGRAVCANTLEVPLDDTEHAVLKSVKHDVLNIAVLETSLHKAMAVLQDDDGADARLTAMRDELACLDAQVGRLAEAIAQGGDLPALVALLQERERRRGHVRAALAKVEHAGGRHGDVGDLGMCSTRCEAPSVIGRVSSGRQRDRHGKRCRRSCKAASCSTRRSAEGERFYTLEGAGTISPVIPGVAGLQRVCVPDGIGSAWTTEFLGAVAA
jgi:hypothetical protein